MPQQSPPLLRPRSRAAGTAAAWAVFCVAGALLPAAPVRAEKADRDKPMEIVADRSSTVDLVNQVSRFTGNVVLTQGTMTLRAERVEVRQTADGYKSGTAWGAPGAPVKYRQKRDGVDEHVEGVADRIEFDGKADTLRFVGNSVVRRTRGNGETLDEIVGDTITWNHNAELFSVQGGTPTASNPSGRVRAVLAPRNRASEAAPAAAPPANRPGVPR